MKRYASSQAAAAAWDLPRRSLSVKKGITRFWWGARHPLEKAVNDLRSAGGEAEAFSCDVSNRESCFALAKHAAECGEVKAVLHIAGLSPHMGDAEKSARQCAGHGEYQRCLYEVMAPGGCVIDTSSMSAYLAPQFVMPKGAYKLAQTDREKFIKSWWRGQALPLRMPARSGLRHQQAFCNLVCQDRCRTLWRENVRCLSVTPGNFDTPMGALESGQADVFKNTPLSNATESRKKSPLCLRFFWMSGWAS